MTRPLLDRPCQRVANGLHGKVCHNGTDHLPTKKSQSTTKKEYYACIHGGSYRLKTPLDQVRFAKAYTKENYELKACETLLK